MSAGPRWSRLDQGERRRQIIAAARKLFSSRHYASVSTREIAEAAGVTRGLLHHYFGSKHDLYLEVAREMLQLPSPPLHPAAEADAGEVWETSVDAWLDLMEANRETWLTAVRAGETGHDPEMRRLLDEASELTADRVLDALGIDSTTAPPQLKALVRAYGGLAQEATREWLERGRLSRAEVRVLLAGAMPLLARQLMPAVLAAGAPTNSPAVIDCARGDSA